MIKRGGCFKLGNRSICVEFFIRSISFALQHSSVHLSLIIIWTIANIILQGPCALPWDEELLC